jgi:dTDP-4-dehydrorhamnose reductase
MAGGKTMSEINSAERNEPLDVLVLGKDGSLGSEFFRHLTLNDKYKPIFLGHADLDITQKARVHQAIQDHAPQVVINCAAHTNVDKAEKEERELALLVNGRASGYLAAAAEKVSATFVNYSTNYVFFGNKPEGYVEGAERAPLNVYGFSKALGEDESLKKCSRTYVIRTSWLYGEPGRGPNSKPSFSDVILAKAENDEEIRCYSDQFGQPTWTSDLVKASLRLITDGMPYGIYHLVNSGTANRTDWAKQVLKLNGFAESVIHSVPTPKDPSLAKRPMYGILQNMKTVSLRHWREALEAYFEEKAYLEELQNQDLY